MSSSELSEDEYPYTSYQSFNRPPLDFSEMFEGLLDDYVYNTSRLRFYENKADRPPLIKKKSRILLATVDDDVETLRTLVDSPKWYQVRDKYGYTLLQIAIMSASKGVFDYLLTLADFPLEAVDRYGGTTVMTALFFEHYDFSDEYYACELVKKGVDINREMKGSSLLHWAIEREFITVVKLLIERDINLNARNPYGETPLHMCIRSHLYESTEMATTLLCCGADPFVRNNNDDTAIEVLFEYCHPYRGSWETNRDLLYLTLDLWSGIDIPAIVLFHTAYVKSPSLEQVIPLITDVNVDDPYDNFCCLIHLLIMDTENLKLLLEKFPSVIKKILGNYSSSGNPCYNSCYGKFYQEFNLKNFVLIEETFPTGSSLFISKINSTKLLENRRGDSDIIQKILYLLSYGMSWCPKNFETIYGITGYNEDLKIFLHMDLCYCNLDCDNFFISCDPLSPLHADAQKPIYTTHIMTRLICDVNLNVDGIIEDLWRMDWNTLFQYFVHPKLQQAHRQKFQDEFKNANLPRVPLLQELARDAFRQYFVKVFQIKTPKQFFNLIKLLPISPVHKKIITFESKLYPIDFDGLEVLHLYFIG